MDVLDGEFVPARPIPRRGTTLVRVRYCECDPMGVVHHGSYVAWLEQARTELLREGGVSYRELESAGVFLVVAGLEMKYRRPGRYDDVLEVECRVSGGGRVKIEHEYEVRLAERGAADVVAMRGSGDDVLLTARSTLVCVGRDMRVRGLPEWLVAGG